MMMVSIASHAIYPKRTMVNDVISLRKNVSEARKLLLSFLPNNILTRPLHAHQHSNYKVQEQQQHLFLFICTIVVAANTTTVAP